MKTQQLRTQIGDSLRRERLAHRPPWSQKDFADELDCTISHLNEIENGNVPLNVEELAILNCVFAVDIALIMPDFSVPSESAGPS